MAVAAAGNVGSASPCSPSREGVAGGGGHPGRSLLVPWFSLTVPSCEPQRPRGLHTAAGGAGGGPGGRRPGARERGTRGGGGDADRRSRLQAAAAAAGHTPQPNLTLSPS